MRCLIIEPNQTLSSALADAVEELGHSALVAGSSAEAKTQLRVATYDILMMAHDLPDRRATELVRMCHATNPDAQTLRLTGCELCGDGASLRLSPHIVRLLAGPSAPAQDRRPGPLSAAMSWLS